MDELTTPEVCELAEASYRQVDYGDQFGHWTVTGLPYRMPGRGGGYLAQCRCSCGRQAVVRVGNLLRGRSRRCRMVGVPPSVNVGEIAWAAGLFEGEGSIFVTPSRNGTPRPRMQLSSTDEDVLRRFHRIVGRGRVCGPYTKLEGRLPRWDWMTASVRTCEEITQAFAPYLGQRRSAKVLEVMGQMGQVIGR